MYLETIKSVKKGKTYYTYLIRESYREKGKVKHRTISNVSKLSKKLIHRAMAGLVNLPQGCGI